MATDDLNLADGPAEALTTTSAGDVDRIARESLKAWAKKTVGAPRRLDKMVSLVRQDEQDFVRVATEIHRREIVEQRAPAPPDVQRRPPAPIFFDLRTVDPWSISPEELRTATEKVDTCSSCGGRASTSCPTCGGSGRSPCGTCGGSGRNAQGTAACPACAGAGAIGCGPCGTGGVVGCAACAGQGMQLVWLTYTQEARLDVRVLPEGRITETYPQLAEPKILTRTDLAPFVVYGATLSSGLVPSGALALEEYERLMRHRPPVDTRLERVSQQQYVRFGAVRRELAYEMAGRRGKLILSGARCAVEVGPDTLSPVRARVTLWAGASAVWGLVLFLLYLALRGSTVYFRNWNLGIGFFLLLAFAALVATSGAVLRMLGVGFKLQRPLPMEIAYPLVLVGALFATTVVKTASSPSVADARAVITAGNAARAVVIIDALESIGTDATEVGALRDDVAILEASRLHGDERVARLDEIAAQGGTRAADAAKLAREDKLLRVRALVASQKLTEALDLADHIFVGADRELPEVQEVRAAVYDAELRQCGADPCRFIAARKAERASPTPERAARTRDLRVKLLDAVTVDERPAETTINRLRRARILDAASQAIAGVVGDDSELAERTRAAQRWAQKAREAVPLIGSDRGVVEELLGKIDDDGGKLHTVIEGIGVYLSTDRRTDIVNGVYVVGESKDTRQQGVKIDYLPSLLLSKAVGHPAQIILPGKPVAGAKEPPLSQTAWNEAGIPIVARWRDGVFVELRIGEANPGGPPPPPRPGAYGRVAQLRITAYPGGLVTVDGVAYGRDSVGPIKVRTGKHEVKVKNSFLGDHIHPIELKDGQNDEIVLVW